MTQLRVAPVAAGPSRAGRRRVRRGPVFWCSAAWIVLVVSLAVLAPVLPIADPAAPDYAHVNVGPGRAHLLGADNLGRDLLSRVIYGSRISLLIGVCAVLLALVVGVVLGLVAGYRGGFVGTSINALTDILLAFPGIVVLMVLVAVRGPSPQIIIIGLGISLTPTFTRLTRANTLTVAKRWFVTAAEVEGARRSRIAVFEILPNVLPAIQSYAFVAVAIAMVAEGSISFLGLGVPPPTPSWGSMIASGTDYLSQYPHISLVPAAALFLTVLAFNLVGESLRGKATAL